MSSVSKQDVLFYLTTKNIDMISPRTDGWTGWGIKQDLYEIKWKIDRILKNAPGYADEQKWLEEKIVDMAVEELSK